MFDVENVPAELLLLAGTRMGLGGINIGATAANNNLIQLHNPAGTGILVTCTDVFIQSTTAQAVNFNLSDVVLATNIATVEQRDSRIGVSAPTTAQVRRGIQVAATGAAGVLQLEAATVLHLTSNRGLFVLGPATNVIFSTTTVNTDLLVTFLWRERVAQPSELNF